MTNKLVIRLISGWSGVAVGCKKLSPKFRRRFWQFCYAGTLCWCIPHVQTWTIEGLFEWLWQRRKFRYFSIAWSSLMFPSKFCDHQRLALNLLEFVVSVLVWNSYSNFAFLGSLNHWVGTYPNLLWLYSKCSRVEKLWCLRMIKK